eukprot:5373374-Pyramimonas_sp.AAC.1
MHAHSNSGASEPSPHKAPPSGSGLHIYSSGFKLPCPRPCPAAALHLPHGPSWRRESTPYSV